MKQRWKKFAPASLIVGVLAAIIALAGYFVFTEFNLFVQISGSLAVLGMAAYILLVPEQVMRALTGRQARHGSSSLLLVIGVFGILAVVNYLAGEYPQQLDLTENSANTLSSETLQILEQLPESVHIVAFYSGFPPDNMIQLFESYGNNSPIQITFEFVDPAQDPLLAKDYGVTQDRSVVLLMGERIEVLDFVFSEVELSAGLIRLMSEPRKVYFLSGHGEHSIIEFQEGGYAAITEYTMAKGYELDTLSLLTSTGVPSDADVIVIAGPLNLFSLAEIEMLAVYLDSGGSMIAMLEPTIFVNNENDDEDLLTSYLLEEWGILLGNDMIVDMRTEGVTFAVADDYSERHPVNSGLEGLYSVYPGARSVQISETMPDIRKTTLAQTAPFDASWAETDLAELLETGAVEPEEGVDYFGPVPVAVAAENDASGARLVVFGDSDFLGDDLVVQYPGNADLFFNAIDWTAQQENLLNLTPREQTQRFVAVPFEYFGSFAALVLICLIPGAFLVAGVLVWVQRRRRM